MSNKSFRQGALLASHLYSRQNGSFNLGLEGYNWRNLHLAQNAVIGGDVLFGPEGEIIASLGGVQQDVEVGITATGATIGDAYQLTATVSRVDTAAAGTGVILPDVEIGRQVVVKNLGANALAVYPPDGSGILDAEAAGSSIGISDGASLVVKRVSSTEWVLGVFSGGASGFTPKDPSASGVSYLDMDGVDDVVNFAVADWIYTSRDEYVVMLTAQPGDTAFFTRSLFEIYYDDYHTIQFGHDSSQAVGFFAFNQGTSKYVTKTMSNTGWPTQASNVAMTFVLRSDGTGDSDAFDLWINGTKYDTESSVSNIGTPLLATPALPNQTHNMELGYGRSDFNTANYYELALFGGTFSDADCATLSGGGNIAATPDRHWPMNDGSGTSVAEATGNGTAGTITNPNASAIWAVTP